MNIRQKTEGFVRLSESILSFLDGKKKNALLELAIKKSFQQNGWFTDDNVRYALSAICGILHEKSISTWISAYPESASGVSGQHPDSVGVIMPSNIPLAGFHDFFCVLMSGNIFTGKCSAQDKILLPALAEMLTEIEPRFKNFIRFTEHKLDKIDAVIATGSNNSARYFKYYFGKYPHIIRKNRNSLAILTGKETMEELKPIGNDIFLYFGLGCRSVSKIFVPENYDFKFFFNAIFDWQNVIHHHKYANNYTYNKALYLMNKIRLWDNGFLLLKEDSGLSSPVAVLYYEYYRNETELCDRLKKEKESIQCIVSEKHIPFGKAQHPGLWDYADKADTMDFLLNL